VRETKRERERERERDQQSATARVATEEGTCGKERVARRERTEAGGIYRWEKRREGGQRKGREAGRDRMRYEVSGW